ncbi:hypothetical protein [Puia dinghuensis]|uniref:Uncharacterized protein n=1 Tax=Puia dinghuensis TaxID=1792502 RepID=A0A8J2UER7_9BACT|nr:hypothetical protein [Puia dinghuensis]GGB07741.1 hypothetical protein GCM10011511_34090 [Puia dinghuensis]
MKKLPPLLLIILIALQPGCKKTNDTTLSETRAHVLYGARPEVDGLGYYIHVDGTGENVIPLNLPSSYQRPTVNTAVGLKFVDTGKRQIVGDLASGGFRVVYVVSIRDL